MKKYNWVAQSAHGAIVLSVSKPKVVTQIGSWVYDINDFVIVGIGRRNHRWKESLVDLSKNDYIIKDGILMATRKHAALIHAWADGAEIQIRCCGDDWDDCHPEWAEDCEYRIKPKTRTVKCKLYHIEGVVGIWVQGTQGIPGNAKLIDKDWREVEVEL